jgi:hypothetical protein
MTQNDEALIPLREVVRLDFLPRLRRGRPISVSAAHRWASKGVRGVRLEVWRVGGTRCTTISALKRFFETLAKAPTDRTTFANPGQQARNYDHRQTAVESELDRWGV